ncbi:hypothetical protein, partial [Streptomyces sanglieri]|uniref:hypothetical protein n=1 Tax=Streptomyces sanglieri TaxID=193460 RepID=UPI0035244F47
VPYQAAELLLLGVRGVGHGDLRIGLGRPVETELTTMTSAMPSASPEATTSAALLRRRSSRRR